MQKKVWHYEKWVGHHASFPPRQSVKVFFLSQEESELKNVLCMLWIVVE